MLILKADHISVAQNGKDSLKNGSIELHTGEHIALIGQNGVGKTTFLKAILGEIPLSSGSLWTKLSREEWAWMPQSPNIDPGITARGLVESEHLELANLKGKMEALALEVTESLEAAESYTECLQSYIDLNGYEWETTVEKALTQLGIEEDLWQQPFNNLSGGQKTKVQIAKMLAKGAALLIFDEPTNHLDFETMNWLAEWIKSFKGTVLIVSHDRAFIDEVAHFTYELTEEGTRKYKGGYKAYKNQKDLERLTAEATYNRQEQERRQLIEAISHYKQWFTKAHNAASERDPYAKKRANKHNTRAKAKEAALERLEQNRIKKPQDTAQINVSFDANSFSSQSMLYLDKVAFNYSNRQPMFEEVSLFIEKKDRVGIIGQNGTGKTTLLNLMTGELQPNKGIVYHHPQLKIGYFKQELDQLPKNQTILDYILSLPNMTQSEARTILACFLFTKEDVFKPIHALSMGEKCRVAFVKLYLSEANLLVLDEPTNYLDIATRERIEEALEAYPGAAVLVSHDQYLLKKIVNRVISLEDRFAYFPGTYEEWQESKHNRPLNSRAGDQLRTLQLQYAQLMSLEVEDDAAQKENLKKIKDLRRQMSQIERGLAES